MTVSATSDSKPAVLIVGGGYVGLYTAWGLEKALASTPMDITLVEPTGYMTYQPLLPEVAGGHVAPSNVTVPLQQALKNTNVIQGSVTSINSASREATVETVAGERHVLHYDHVVIGLGAVTRTFPTPGLREEGVGFKTVEEAVFARSHVLEQIALAAETSDPAVRAKALTFVFVGGGYTGVEALAELSDLSKRAVETYPNLSQDELRWVLVEMLDRVAPEVGPQLARWTLGELRRRGIDIRFKTTMKSCVDGNVVLSDGSEIPAGTIVWTAGVKPNPVLDDTDIPRGPKGHVVVNNSFRVQREDGSLDESAWAAGDNAQVRDLTADSQPAYYPPNAQNALRQAKMMARNIVAAIDGKPLEVYRHKSLGTVASYGVGRGAANIRGIKVTGFPAWLMHRGYHALAMPTVSRKWLIVAGWVTNPLSRPSLSPLTSMTRPRDAFVRSTPE
ncbi:MAG: pyridine nucleotide-disulfide oxidoreductase [Glaciihabitans sp.]|nr:pyridine nucleotide-disulfide oxidoreductase [Glaciihabitans sp.]